MPNPQYAISPFDTYVLYMGIMLHFSQRKFYYNKERSNLSYSTFEANRNNIIYHKLSNTYGKQELYELFISNMVDQPKKHILTYQNKAAKDILSKWRSRMDNVGKIFIQDFKRFVATNKFESLDDIYAQLTQNNVVKLEPLKAENIEQIVQHNPLLGCQKTVVRYGIDPIVQLKEYNPEFVAILDEFFSRNYGSFLEKYLDSIDDRSEFHLKVFKYKSFLDMDTILKDPKIQALHSL